MLVLGFSLIFESYKMTRSDYYLTISGSSPDDYTAVGQFMFVVGIIILIAIFAYIFVPYIKRKK